MNHQTGNDAHASADVAGTSAPNVSVQGLTKRYGEVTAIDGVSFSLQPGTVTGFLGPNGAGKSTTGGATVRSVKRGRAGKRR